MANKMLLGCVQSVKSRRVATYVHKNKMETLKIHPLLVLFTACLLVYITAYNYILILTH